VFRVSVSDVFLPSEMSSSSLSEVVHAETTATAQLSPNTQRQRGRKVQAALWQKGLDNLTFLQP
jgi:hypothetical protein